MSMKTLENLKPILEQYALPYTLCPPEPFGCGHINDTLLLRVKEAEGPDLVLQRINRYVFKKPDELMDNMVAVTEHIRKGLSARGEDPARRVLQVLKTEKGAAYARDEAGEYWRLTVYIPDSICYQQADEALFEEAGRAFGCFQEQLADFPAETLKETIPGFHDTRARYEAFAETAARDPLGRKQLCLPEVEKVLSRKTLAGSALALLERGEIPLRVTHNDTKLNNVMFDRNSGKALCVLDLDTVMPGLAMNDFGDAVRFGASTAAEDEQDLSKVHFDRKLYDAYLKGYLEGCGGSLTPKERDTLFLGALLMTYEVGLRFLKDYLEGDVYFKTAYPEHNLVRSRTQLKLLEEMEEQFRQELAQL